MAQRVLAELIERRTRAGDRIFYGPTRGLRLVLKHHEMRLDRDGQQVATATAPEARSAERLTLTEPASTQPGPALPRPALPGRAVSGRSSPPLYSRRRPPGEPVECLEVASG